MSSWPQSGGLASLQAKRARGLLETALKRKPSERVAFIDGACGDDERLRDEVLDLLDASEDSIASAAGPQIQLPQDRAGRIVAAALERRRNERQAFLEGACAGDEALRVRALSLLASVDTGNLTPARIAKPVPDPAPISFEPLPEPPPPVVFTPPPAPASVASPAPVEEPTRIAPPTEEATRIAPPASAPTVHAEAPSCQWRPGMSLEGRRVGPYQLLHKIGKGGMGSVYAATRADQEYKKIVAIKLVTSDLGTDEMLRRFRNERQVLASLDHPHIARLLDGGSTEDGLPYLVMEYVDGLPIDRYCEAQNLSLADRLKLFQKVCSAVQFAHQNLVVHRDIKPSNILVGTNGEPKLLDFGIARLMTAEFSAEEIELSRGEAQPMTLRYASPEQVRGDPITTESDIYSMGVLLYELVAGEHPFQDALTGRAAIENAIIQREPQKPSVVLKARAGTLADKAQRAAATRRARELDGDVDSILMMPLAKQPRARYPSAESFAWDITRYLNGFPVYGRRDDMGYRARKFVRRHALSVISAALVVIALIVSTVVSFQFLQTTRAAQAKAQSNFEKVRKLANFVLFDFDKAIRAGPTAARKVLVTEALEYLDGLAKSTSGDLSLSRELVEGYLKVGDLQGNPHSDNVGDTAGAKASYGKALQLAATLRTKYPADPRAREAVARVDMKLGDIAAFTGNAAEAIQKYRQAQEVFASLGSADEKAKQNLATVTERIGTVQLKSGDTNGALTSYERYLGYTQELILANPKDVDVRHNLALAYEQVGKTMTKTGAIAEGLEKLRKARDIDQETAALNPQSSARVDVAAIDYRIGATLADAGRTAEAVDSFRSAVEIMDTLAAEDPKNTGHKRTLHVMLGRLADALYATGKKPEARQVTERTLKVLRPLVDAPDALDHDKYAYCWLLLTTPFQDLRAPALARNYAERLVQASQEKDPSTLDLLARAYDAIGEPARAVETETKALALLPPGSTSALKTELTENLAAFRAHAKSGNSK